MAVLDEVPGIGVVVRVRGLIAEEYSGRLAQQDPLPFRPSTSTYIESFDDAEFSVDFAVDRLYDFARDELHYLQFAVTVDGSRLKAVCDISWQDAAAGHGRARNSLDRTASYDAQRCNCYVEKFRFPIVERGNVQWLRVLPLPPSLSAKCHPIITTLLTMENGQAMVAVRTTEETGI
ncbi:hypothetical protein PG984_014072 [Apiospora sp. TS-2023a]